MTVQTRPVSTLAGFPLSLASPWIAFGLFVLTLVVRIPFASQTLNHWDSVNHALALTSFDVATNRPQAPGYILYIGFARLVNLIVPDAQTALVIVSMLASAVAVAFLFLLGARMASRELGLIAALLMLTSPPFWFDGEVALPYVVEGCAALVLTYLLYCVQQGESRLAPLVAVVFAIAVGMRQQLAFFYAPLVVVVLWKTSWRARLEAIAWFVFVCLLWFVPLVSSTGGINAYFTALGRLNSAFADEYVLFGSGGTSALLRNIERIGSFVLYALNLAVIPVLWGVFQALRRQAVRSDARTRFVVLWILPALLFYVLFHMGSPGLIYVFLPALFLIAAFGLHDLTRTRPRLLAPSVGILLAANILLFLVAPSDLFLGRSARVLNYAALRQHDTSLMARVDVIRSDFDPATTLIIADDWRFAEYYLPSFRVLHLPPDPELPMILAFDLRETYMGAPRVDLAEVEQLVWFDPSSPRTFRGTIQECKPLADGWCLPFLKLRERGGLKITNSSIEERASE